MIEFVAKYLVGHFFLYLLISSGKSARANSTCRSIYRFWNCSTASSTMVFAIEISCLWNWGLRSIVAIDLYWRIPHRLATDTAMLASTREVNHQVTFFFPALAILERASHQLWRFERQLQTTMASIFLVDWVGPVHCFTPVSAARCCAFSRLRFEYHQRWW